MSILQVENLTKEFGSLVAVNDVSFSLDKGQVLGLIGPNGAGKTTLLRMLATLLRSTRGQVEFLGYDSQKEYLKIRKHIGFLPDFFTLYNDLKLDECLKFFADAYGVEERLIPAKVNKALEYVDLADKRDSFIRNLSRGMVQRVGVATLLVRDPEIFLLDEPASGLDPMARINLRNILNRLSEDGKTVIISSHILTELSGFCSHIAIMNKGKVVVFGAVDEVQAQTCGMLNARVKVLGEVERAVELIATMDEAKVVSADDHQITVALENNHDKLAMLNSHLVSNGIKVVGLSEEKMGLEDLFMEISSQHAKEQL